MRRNEQLSEEPCDRPGCTKSIRSGIDTWLAVHSPTGQRFILQSMSYVRGLGELISLNRHMPATTRFQKILSEGTELGGFDFTLINHSHGGDWQPHREQAMREHGVEDEWVGGKKMVKRA